MSGYPQYVWALVRADQFDAALTQLETALVAEHRGDASRLAPEVAKDAMGLVAAAWLAQDSSPTAAVMERLSKAGATLPKGPALRFLLTWETDSNDVDFHVRDGKGAQSCYSSPELPMQTMQLNDVGLATEGLITPDESIWRVQGPPEEMLPSDVDEAGLLVEVDGIDEDPGVPFFDELPADDWAAELGSLTAYWIAQLFADRADELELTPNSRLTALIGRRRLATYGWDGLGRGRNGPDAAV